MFDGGYGGESSCRSSSEPLHPQLKTVSFRLWVSNPTPQLNRSRGYTQLERLTTLDLRTHEFLVHSTYAGQLKLQMGEEKSENLRVFRAPPEDVDRLCGF